MLSKGLVELLNRDGVNTTQFYNQEVMQGCQITGTTALSLIRKQNFGVGARRHY
jgi:hypothetical protein